MAKLRIVLDSNVWIFGILWTGVPHRIIGLVEQGKAETFATAELLTELREALGRPKFARRFEELESSPREAMEALTSLVRIVEEGRIEPVVHDDPDDDRILACAVSAGAQFAVSGDRHLLAVKMYRGIRVVTPSEFWTEWKSGKR